jgi:hypothetical protein
MAPGLQSELGVAISGAGTVFAVEPDPDTVVAGAGSAESGDARVPALDVAIDRQRLAKSGATKERTSLYCEPEARRLPAGASGIRTIGPSMFGY